MQQTMPDGSKAGCREPSVMAMRLKADWESATPLYEKAATAFSVSLPRHCLWHGQHTLVGPGNQCQVQSCCTHIASGHSRPGLVILWLLHTASVLQQSLPPWLLQLQKNFSRARQAAEKAATGHERQGSSWQAAKQLERAGECDIPSRAGHLIRQRAL